MYEGFNYDRAMQDARTANALMERQRLGDDEAPVPGDTLETCEGCGNVWHEDEMHKWAGERRCPACCHLCPVCNDDPVLSEREFCWFCAHQAMGVDV